MTRQDPSPPAHPWPAEWRALSPAARRPGSGCLLERRAPDTAWGSPEWVSFSAPEERWAGRPSASSACQNQQGLATWGSPAVCWDV